MSTFEVTTLSDVVDAGDGVTSLREAIALAEANSGADTITFSSSILDALAKGTITLGGTGINLSSAITIEGDVDGDGVGDITIDANNASQIFIITSGNTSLNGLELANGSNASSGGAIFKQNADLTVTNSTFSGNTSSAGDGGAIYMIGSGSTNIANSTFTGNEATYGGAVHNFSSTLTVINSTFVGNDATYGGGISANNNASSTTTVVNSTVTGNTANFGGGLYFGSNGTATVTNSIAVGNTATDLGNEMFGSPTETGVNILSGTASNVFATVSNGAGVLGDNGGGVGTVAILASGSAANAGSNTALPADSLDLDGDNNTSEFLSTDATGSERVQDTTVDIGAFELTPEAGSLVVTTLDDTVDAYDDVTSLREAIAFAEANSGADTITFSSSILDALAKGTVTLGGTGINLFSEITIEGDVDGDGVGDITIDANNTSQVFYILGDVTLNGLTITNASNTGNGGAIRNDGSDLTVTNSTFEGNTVTDGFGGAIYASGGGTTTIANSTFDGNTATASFLANGGAVFNNASTVTIVNSTFVGNEADVGGAIAANNNASTNTTIINSTITGNSAGDGGGASFGALGTATLTNSIVLGNTATNSNNEVFGTPTETGVNILSGTASDVFASVSNGAGVLSDNGGGVETVALLVGGSAVNAGTNAVLPADSLDLDGDNNTSETLSTDATGSSRVNGSSVDIGAYELPPEAGSLVVTTLDDTVDAFDGVTSLREAIAYAESLTAGTNSDGDADNDGNANDTITFSSGVLDGKGLGTITLGGANISFGSTITIEGDVDGDGVGDITIDGNNASQIFSITNGDVTLNGLELTNGSSASGGGAIDNDGSNLRVTNSTFSNNAATGSSGGAINATGSGSTTIANSTFNGNSAAEGGAIHNGSSDLTLVNTTFHANTATSDGGAIYTADDANVTTTIIHNTITGNSANNGGGIHIGASSQATLTNSIVLGNSSTSSNDEISGNPTQTGTNLLVGQPSIVFAEESNGAGVLGDNGGGVQTVAISLTGAAANAGSNAALPADSLDLDGDNDTSEILSVDAVGNSRINNSDVDIGAVELEASSLVVTTLDDVVDAFDGVTSLREALTYANVTNPSNGAHIDADNDGNDNDTVSFSVSMLDALGKGTITLDGSVIELSSALITIDGDVDGDGVGDITIDANNASGIFQIAFGEVTLDSLELTNGSSAFGGSAVYTQNSDLTITNSTLSGNAATSSSGGAIHFTAGSNATIANSTFEGNSTSGASTFGGAIHNSGSAVTVINSTFAGNDAIIGGAISANNHPSTTTTIINSTITGNTATFGGGLYFGTAGTATVSNSIVLGNSASTSNDEIMGSPTQTGTNILSGGADDVFTVVNNGAGVLGNNGGGVQTVAILSGGLAQNTGSNADLPTDNLDLDGDNDTSEALPFDATGNDRVSDSTVDIGAMELQVPTPVTPPSTPSPTPTPNAPTLGDDTLNGTAANDAINGGDGSDNLDGGQGNDALNGGNGNDSVDGGTGNDFLTGGAGQDTLEGGEGDDASYAGAGNDSIGGGEGDDTLGGGDGDDFVTGGAGSDVVYGGAGSDSGFGGDGTDSLFGGEGSDTLGGGGGSDSLFGGEGNDEVFGGEGNDFVFGGAGSDSVFGGDGDDTIGGGDESDTVNGGGGTDNIYSGDAADSVSGGAGNDLVFGGGGNDTLSGGEGDDELYSGAGDDTYVFETGFGNDSIGGFESLGDNTLDFSALGLSSIADLTITQDGDAVIIDTGSGTITLYNTQAGDITSDDFIF